MLQLLQRGKSPEYVVAELMTRYLVEASCERVAAYRPYRKQLGTYWTMRRLERLRWGFMYGPVTAMSFNSSGEINIKGDLIQGGTVSASPINAIAQENDEWSYHNALTKFFFQYGQNNKFMVDGDGDLTIPGDFEGNATIDGTNTSSYYFYFSGTPVIEMTSSGDLRTVASLDTNANI